MIETNMGKTKAEIILELLVSINKGNSSTGFDPVNCAVRQYENLVNTGIIKEVDGEEI